MDSSYWHRVKNGENIPHHLRHFRIYFPFPFYLLRGEIVLSTHFVNPLKEGANDSKAAGEETCYYNNGILLLSLESATVQSIGF